MRKNRKYNALLFLVIATPFMFFCCTIIVELIISTLIYIKYGAFIFNIDDFYLALKIVPFGIPVGIAMWYLECRRLGIKIFGK